MRTTQKLMAFISALAAIAVFTTATPAKAQEPHYLQALSDLRTARDYCQYDTGRYKAERRHAVDEINKAIDEIKHAAWDDGKNTRFAPPAAGATNGWAPLHYGYNALNAAQDKVSHGVDTPQNQGLRERAIAHISEALHTVGLLLRSGAQ